MFSSRSLLLVVRVRHKGTKPHLSLFLTLALPVLHQLLLSCDALLSLLPGRLGDQARLTVDSVHAFVLAMIQSEPQNSAQVNVSDEGSQVWVDVKTVGWKGRDDT